MGCQRVARSPCSWAVFLLQPSGGPPSRFGDQKCAYACAWQAKTNWESEAGHHRGHVDTMELEREEIGVLVADSGAFIKGAPLQKWSSKVVTIREVIAEIRDKATRERLQVLPYELTFKEPSTEALQHGRTFFLSLPALKYVCF